MEECLNTTADKVAPGVSGLNTRRDRSILLLSCAGVLVIVGTYTAAIMWASIITSDPTHNSWGTWGTRIFIPLGMMLAATVLGALVVLRPSDAQMADGAPRATMIAWLIFAALVVAHVGFAFLYFGQGPSPKIDTFTFQRDASNSLLHGTNPFGGTQANIFDAFHTPLFYGPGLVVDGRVQAGFQYPPLTLLWVLPGYLLGDVRYSYIFAVIVTALFSFMICPNARGLWVVAALFFSPVTFLVEFLCWTEPLVLMMLSVCVYAAVKKKWWMPIALGLFLATKQYNVLALPLIGLLIRPFNWRDYWKLAALSLGVATLTVLPFAIWNFRGLWHDLVLFHLAQPFRADAVSFAVPFPWVLKIGPLLLIAFIAGTVLVAKRSPAIFAAAYGVSLLLFVSTNKQAFMNYYFLIGNAFFLSVAAMPLVAKSSAQTRT
jgi:hypothetical protein